MAIPIFQSANFEFAGETDYNDLKYIRLNNTPNHQALHEKLAACEEAEAALVMGSGMAAISTALLTVLKAGDHLLAQDCLYGGTYSFLTQDLADFGIEFTFVSGQDPAAWKAALRPNTKAFYVEAMTNPLVEVADLSGVAAFCAEHGLVSMIDNTFASPVNYRPCAHGYTLSLHSATKYLNGHSDIVAGAVLGPREWISRVVGRLNHLGGCLDPSACHLLHRGLKTLELRVERQNANALALAQALEGKVEKVYYPFLESHPQYARARSLFTGGGGVLSFEMADYDRFFSRVRLPIVAPSLGGVETLVTRPVTTSHSSMTAEERARAGISDRLIRVSVGIEDAGELIEDFLQAVNN